MSAIVEVTYCEECDFFRKKDSWPDEVIGECQMHSGTYMFGGDFCSYGKPRKRRKNEQYTGQPVSQDTNQTV